VYTQTDLRAKFLALSCSERGNVQDFLESLQVKEELVQVVLSLITRITSPR